MHAVVRKFVQKMDKDVGTPATNAGIAGSHTKIGECANLEGAKAIARNYAKQEGFGVRFHRNKPFGPGMQHAVPIFGKHRRWSFRCFRSDDRHARPGVPAPAPDCPAGGMPTGVESPSSPKAPSNNTTDVGDQEGDMDKCSSEPDCGSGRSTECKVQLVCIFVPSQTAASGKYEVFVSGDHNHEMAVETVNFDIGFNRLTDHQTRVATGLLNVHVAVDTIVNMVQ